MRLFFWKQYNEKTRMTKTCTLHVHSRFFYFVKFLNLLALSEQGWAFFMQKLQLNSGQELCTVNMIWNSSIKSSNFTVNKRKIAEGTIFHIKSSNYTVDKTT